MKVLTIANNKDELSKIETGVIVGLKRFSTGINVQMDINEIRELVNCNDVFVVINKTIFNGEIDELASILKELSNIDIKGILFYDLSIVEINDEYGLNLPLVWNQTHMVTNYNTCNYYFNKGVSMCMLSNEITLDEMIEIKRKTNMQVIANVIFNPIMAHSRRSLLSNYFASIKMDKVNDEYLVEENVTKNKYIVKEDDTGTTFIYNNTVNGIVPLFDMVDNDFDYVVIDKSFLSFDDYNNCLNVVNKVIDKNIEKEEAKELVKKIIGDDTGFFYKKTIYKVK